MMERLQRNLLTVERHTQTLSLNVQKAIDVILRNQEIFDDPRIRTITYSRATHAGDWVCTGTLAFLDHNGQEQPFAGYHLEGRHYRPRD